MKKLIALTLAIMLALSVGVIGASADDVVNISMMVYDRGEEFSSGNSLTDNELTRWINSQMEPQGVHVNFIAVPRSGADNQINMMLASNSAPDVIRTYDRQRVGTYAKQGGLMDLTPYMDQLDPDYVAKNAEALKFTQFDGKQYALPGVFGYHGKSNDAYIRKDLLDKLGMEVPKTREELVKFLYAVKEKFPDIIPFAMGGKGEIPKFHDWIVSYTSRANERDNYMYEPTFTLVLKPGHKDALKELNQLYLDGIFSPDFVLDNDDSKYNQDIANGKVAFVAHNSDACIRAYDTADDPNYHMIEFEPFKNADGNYEVQSQDAISHYVFVPKASESRIDAIVKFLRFLTNEENAKNIKYSIIGRGSDVVDGVPVKKSNDDLRNLGLTAQGGDICFMYSNFPFERDVLAKNFVAIHPKVPLDVAKQKYDIQYSNYFDKRLIPAALDSDEKAVLLQSLIIEFVFKVITAPAGKFEEVYNAEYQKLVNNGLNDVLNDRAAWYDANIANKA